MGFSSASHEQKIKRQIFNEIAKWPNNSLARSALDPLDKLLARLDREANQPIRNRAKSSSKGFARMRNRRLNGFIE